jgi:formate dehydrogenase iron-sulfur subunit
MSVGLEPACSKACPTDSIQFGPIDELRRRAEARLEQLKAQGETKAQLYGDDPDKFLGGLNSFYLLVDEPEVYGLPATPKLPSRNLAASSLGSAVGAAVVGAVGLVTLRKRRADEVAEAERGGQPRA